MSEYISKESIVTLLEQYGYIDKEMERDLASIPSADVRPNIHGHWIDCGCMYGYGNTSFRKYKCSVCREKVYEQPMNIKYHKFCLHCGANMDVEPKGVKGD